MKYNYTVTDRFLSYVKIDTQSDEESPTCPSTAKQLNLSKQLLEEVKALGLKTELDENGYLYATIPSNTDKKVPVICFCSHVDTAPDFSGKGVKPRVFKNYQGEKITYPLNSEIFLSPETHPYLKERIGDDIIVTSGDTLLGADDKAGVAIIMDLATFLVKNPQIKHGEISILFTPDEEIGRGVDKVNIDKIGAEFAYTLDGGKRGEFEDETFSADGAVITIKGAAIHPGYAKNKMENAIKIASEIVAALPKHRLSPETTDKKLGFVHPTGITGKLESAEISLIIRAFDNESLAKNGEELRTIMEMVLKNYPNSSAELTIKEQYRNMKLVLDKFPFVIGRAEKAIDKIGIKSTNEAIRGGTDGSKLSYMGLPCPNLFTGMQEIHSPKEWISVQDMEKSVDMLVELVQIWEQES